MSIRKKIFIPMIALTVACSAAILLTSIFLYNRELNSVMRDDIHFAAMAISHEIDHAKSSSHIVASAMVKNNNFIEAVISNDRGRILDEANKILSVTDIEFCTIINKEGIVLARTHVPDFYGDSVTWQKSVVVALLGEVSTVVDRGTTVLLSVRTAAPVYSDDGTLLGAVTLGYRLDTAEFVQNLKEITGCEVTIFSGSQRISTTIKDDRGDYAVGTKAQDAVTEMVLKGGFYIGKANVLGREMITEYAPLYSAMNEVVGMMFAGKYTDEDKNKLLSFIFQGILVTIIIVALTALIASIISNSIDNTVCDSEKKMKASEKRLQTLFDAAPIGINLWNKNRENIYVNEAAVKFLGLSSKDEYYEKFFDLSPKYQPDGRLSAEKGPEELKKAYEEGYSRYEWVHQKTDGELVPCDITMIRMDYEDVSVVAGYTYDLRQLQAANKARDMLLESLDAMLVITSLNDDEIIFMNDAMKKTFSFDDSVIGKKCYDLIGKCSLRCGSCPKNNPDCISGELYVRENFHPVLKRYFKILCRVIDWPDGTKVFLEQCYDVTDIKQALEVKNTLAILGNILDSIDVNIYASIPETGELLFVNKQLKKLFGRENDDLVGEYCYKVFRGLDAQCENCPCKQLDENPDLVISWEEYELGKCFLHSDCYIDWPNGEKIHLQHAVDISDHKKMMQKLDKRLEQQSLMAHISQSFLSGEDIDTLLTNALCKVGEFMGIAQILLYKTDENDEHTIICRNGWMSSKYNLPSRIGGTIVISDKMLDIFKAMKNFDKFYITADDPGVKEEMAPYRKNFHNYLTAGILIDNKLYAVVDFSRADDKKWNRYEIQMASFTANIFSGVLQKHVVQKQLINAKEMAEKSSRYKTEFLARMSHEIRTPMNAIIGMTELALRDDTQEAKNEHIYTVKQASSNLLAIINDILDFSKIEAGKMEILNDDYSFASLLNDVISIARMRAQDSEVRFAVKADSKIPASLCGDETRIRQSVLNILNNAVKYTDKGYVSFGIYCDFIDSQTVNITFEVTDTGIGIKNEDLGRLFSDFTQFDLEKNRGIEGVGLGLAITKSIVEEMGGKISVQSEYGKGSTFTINLPQKFKSAEPLAKIEQPEDKKVLILIYERRDVNADALVYTLNNLSVNSTIVTRGTELYKEMQNNEYNYLFIPYALYKKNEDTILKFGANTKTVILIEFGTFISEKDLAENLNILVMPIYCTQIAGIFNGVQTNQQYESNNENIARFTAPSARILVVDDINTNLKVAEGLLAPYNMNVELCNTGKGAILAVQSGKYDIVFMDHKMPGIDGVEATKRIRERDKAIPIIALTANAVSGMKEMFIENGFNDFLSKPIETVKLNAILEKWIPKDKQVKK